MVQFFETQPTPGLGDLLGAGVGSGLQSGLQQMLQQKLSRMQAMTPFQEISSQLRERELAQKETKEGERKSEWEYTQHKDFRKEVSTNYKDALETETRLNRMSELNKTGKLTGPSTAAVLGKMGIPLGVLNNPDSEEFDKLSKDMLKNIRTYFGSRINVVEVENFLKTIPALTNSPEGRDRVINNLKLLLEPRKMMFEEYRKIRRESNEAGKPMPIDLEETVLERIKSQLDQISEQFVAGPSQEIASTIGEQPQQVTENFVIMIDPSGKRRRISKKDAKAAKKAGYKGSK